MVGPKDRFQNLGVINSKPEDNPINRRLAEFGKVYVEVLTAAMEKYPDKYKVKDAALVASRTVQRIRADGIRSISLDGDGMKGAAKALNVKNNYKAWDAYFNG